MRTLVVYDSVFGNTERIARLITTQLEANGPVWLVAAADAGKLDMEGIDLLVVGGPTHRHGVSQAMRTYLAEIPRGALRTVVAATFDTRYRGTAWLTGSAASKIAQQLKKGGAQLVAAPESFFMEKDAPPRGKKRRHTLEQLAQGEEERARAWATSIAASAQGTSLAPGMKDSATSMVATTLGIFAGLLGLEHGYFEILQGNGRPSSPLINAIGPPCDPATVWHGCEPALTLIPTFLLTGILASVISLMLMLTASLFIRRRYSGLALLMLALLLLLVGGGFTPLPFGIFAGVAGLLMRSSWQAPAAAGLWRALAGLWPWSFLVTVLWYVGLFTFPAFVQGLTTLLGALGLVLVLLALLTGFAHDRGGQVAAVSPV